MIELTPKICQRSFVFIMLVILVAELHALPSPESSDSTVETSNVNFVKSHNSHPLGILKSLANEGHRHKRQECHGGYQCNLDQWCYDNMCDYPCPRLDCATIKPPNECQSDRECQNDQEWCWGNICEDPCYRLACRNQESPTGRCVVINHQPRCLED